MSPRRRQVLALIAEGYRNSEIASELFISEETVKSHVKALLRAFQARSRAHAVAAAFRAGDLS